MGQLEDQIARAGVVARRRTGGMWMAGGALWLAAGIVDGGSVEAIWIVADLLLLAGLVGLGQLRPYGRSRLGHLGLGVAIIGRLVFVAAELVSMAQHNDENVLLPIGALLSALGMLAVGTAVARGGVWRGASRFGPLVMGLYPFVVMFPLVAANGGQPSVGGIAGWGLAAVVLGVAVLAQDSTVPVGQRPTPMANPIRTV